ncbi:MAG: four helix bundle protein [Bacteroidetes bacterium]|nr:four helix bundle protein [Bacteroidota bacterium]
MKSYHNLSDRLISFAVSMITVADQLPKNIGGCHLARQLTRSGSSPALQYGEAQSAESRSDFIHKMKIAVKELRETYNCLKIIDKLDWLKEHNIHAEQTECNELISIFVKSISTAQKNRSTEKTQQSC